MAGRCNLIRKRVQFPEACIDVLCQATVLTPRSLLRCYSLIFICILLSGCVGGGLKKTIDNNIYLKNYKFDSISCSYILPGGKIINSPYEVSFSPNKQKIIFSRVNECGESEVYLYNKNENSEKKITNNIYIETNPVVNDNGTYAYILSEYSTRKSKIYLNNKLLDKNVGLFKNLDINNNYLIYNLEDFSKNKHYLRWLNIEDKKIKSFEFPLGYIQKIHFISRTKALIQYYSLENMSMDVGVFNLQSQTFRLIKDETIDEVIKNVNFNSDYTLSSIPFDKKNIKLLFNAYYNYYNFQLANPFASSNNFMGRLTWNQSYRLTNLVKLYKATNNLNILRQIDSVIARLLSGINEKIGVNNKFSYKYSFSTKKYSQDKTTPISLMVTDAKIYESIVNALNCIQGELQVKYTPIIKKYVSGLIDYYENYYDTDTSMYTFQYGSTFLFDGVWLPFNQQNSFSILMLDMYILTSEKKYKDRAFSLAQTFKNQIVYVNGKIVWHYWPNKFYNGWGEDDNISLNTPNRNKSEDNLYEDLSHAGINVSFIYKFQLMFPDKVFTTDDISLLRNTVDGFIHGRKFSRFMSGDITYQDANYRFIPTFGWSLLSQQKLNSFYISLMPYFYPDFDQQAWDNNLDPINLNELKNEVLAIYSEKYDSNSSFLESQSTVYNLDTINEYFELEK